MREDLLDLRCLEDTERREFKPSIWDWYEINLDEIRKSMEGSYWGQYQQAYKKLSTEHSDYTGLVVDDPFIAEPKTFSTKNPLPREQPRVRLKESKPFHSRQGKANVRRNR